MARQHKKSWRRLPQGSANQPAFPAQWCYGLWRALPGDRAFLPPSRARSSSRALDTSVGVSGPHGFAVRVGVARRATPARPSHPALHVRDDAYAPPDERGTAGEKHIFLKNESEIFSQGGWTVASALHRLRTFDFLRTPFLGLRSFTSGRERPEIAPISSPSGESVAEGSAAPRRRRTVWQPDQPSLARGGGPSGGMVRAKLGRAACRS
jgi:hypothetical protein